MLIDQQAARQPKVEEKRRGARTNSRVPVVIEWESSADGKLREQAFTRVIGPYGCMVVLAHELPVKQGVHVVNLATKQANSGVIVSKGSERPEGWELGIELTQPPRNFWGLEQW